MKMLAFLALFFSVSSAFALERASITFMDLDPAAFGDRTFFDGSIAIDPDGKQLSFTLSPKGPGVSFTVELPIISQATHLDHTETWVAEKDGRPYDGIYERITVRRPRSTKPLRPHTGLGTHAVTSRYDTEVSNRTGQYRTRSFFLATPFRRVP